jgi:hypothetical protein
MPGPPDDDDDAPRWEPPAPSTEAPTWESKASEETPRWDPDADVPRWEPDAPTPRWTPGGAAAPGRFESTAPVARPAPVSPAARPFVWWRSHPWIVVWAVVLAIPLVAVALRLLDESEHEGFVAPLAWTFAGLLAAALAMAAAARGRRSPARAALGLAGALAVAGILLWPVTQVTLGRTPCPSRAGPNLGVPVAAAALAAWREGKAGDAGWRDGRADAAWSARARGYGVLEYSLVESGCWERVAPVDGSLTWHEFRVTVQTGKDNPLSKIVVVHTARDGEGWKITAIEGPLP